MSIWDMGERLKAKGKVLDLVTYGKWLPNGRL
jgi:hypothetical protein